MGSSFTATVQEDRDNRKWLMDNNYNLALAKTVIADGKPVVNTIFKGEIIIPSMNVTWQETYGLNYSMKIPAKGAMVDGIGEWQECQLGDGYIINKFGSWDPKKDGNEPGALNVANEFNSELCIIVGVKDDQGRFGAIFFNDSKLPMHGKGSYKPSMAINLWFGSGQRTSSVISEQQTTVKTYDMKDKQHWFQYTYKDGKWTDSNSPYFKLNTVPPIFKFIRFGIAFGAVSQFIEAFEFQMDGQGWRALIALTTENSVYSVEMKKKSVSDKPDPDPVFIINKVLEQCRLNGDLPRDEIWAISDTPFGDRD